MGGRRGSRWRRRRGLVATANGQLTIKNAAAATATEGALSTVAANVARPGRRPAVAAAPAPAAASSGRNNNNYDVNFYRLLSRSLSLSLSLCPFKTITKQSAAPGGVLHLSLSLSFPLYECVCVGGA